MAIGKNSPVIKRASFILLAVLASLVGVYPVIYFIIDRRFGLLNSKSETLLESSIWNISFYTHIMLGGVALLIGWTQFVSKWRKQNPKVHRQIGKVYVFTVLLSAITSIYIALFATGGIVPSVGFICMGVVWFFTTFKAYLDIRNKKILSHQRMMIYSYATCLAAVTLRIYLPIFISVSNDFNKAYAVVSWLSWVPNLIVAYFIIQHLYPNQITVSNNQFEVIATNSSRQKI